MNSYERTMAAIYGESYDHTPVIPLIIQHALHIAGIPHGEYSTDPARMAEAQLFALREYDYDGLHVSSDNYIVSEAMGNTVRVQADEPPQKLSAILESNADLTQLKDFDPLSDGRMPVLIEATKIVRRELGESKAIKANCDSGPFSVAASLRGAENLFYDMADDEKYLFDLLEQTSAAIIKYAKALANAGAHIITYGESTASLIGREDFERVVLPFNRYVIGEIKKTGLPVFFHMCGNVDHLVDLLPQTGADAIELDSFTDLERAYALTGHELCIEGTVDTVNVLLNGGPEDVKAAAGACIRASKGRRLILSSGCEVPRYSPKENIHALVEAAKITPACKQ